jgi:hypothetical protein
MARSPQLGAGSETTVGVLSGAEETTFSTT